LAFRYYLFLGSEVRKEIYLFSFFYIVDEEPRLTERMTERELRVGARELCRGG
jgi:hypothetical protein